MRLTHFTDYGLRVLMYLGCREDEHVTTEQLAQLFNVSQEHLLKVVRRLCALGYVQAKRGPQGGIRFLPATREVTVGEVIRNLEPQALMECFDPKVNSCPITPVCGLAPLLRRAGAAFYRELDRVRVGELTHPSQLHQVLEAAPAAGGRNGTRRRSRH